MPDIVSKLLLSAVPPCGVAVLFTLNLSRRPFLRQVVDLDLLLCTGFDSEHVALFLSHIFTQRPMTDRKMERNNGCCFVQQQLLANSIKNFISCGPKYTKHQNLFDS